MKIIDCVYLRMTHKLAVFFDEGAYLRIPCNWIKEFEGYSEQDLLQIEFHDLGEPNIHIEHKDMDMHVRGLVLNYFEHIKAGIDPNEDYKFHSAYWQNLLNLRDRFIVKKGLWDEFVASLPR
jgi:hypothetical protein